MYRVADTDTPDCHLPGLFVVVGVAAPPSQFSLRWPSRAGPPHLPLALAVTQVSSLVREASLPSPGDQTFTSTPDCLVVILAVYSRGRSRKFKPVFFIYLVFAFFHLLTSCEEMAKETNEWSRRNTTASF